MIANFEITPEENAPSALNHLVEEILAAEDMSHEAPEEVKTETKMKPVPLDEFDDYIITDIISGMSLSP